MTASGLVLRSNLVGTGRAISVLFSINGVRNQRSHLVGPPFPEFKARFSATAGWHFSRDLTRRLVIGGHGHSHVSVKVWLKLPLGAILSLTTWQNRNWGMFKSCWVWKWPWEENSDPKELSKMMPTLILIKAQSHIQCLGKCPLFTEVSISWLLRQLMA